MAISRHWPGKKSIQHQRGCWVPRMVSFTPRADVFVLVSKSRRFVAQNDKEIEGLGCLPGICSEFAWNLLGIRSEFVRNSFGKRLGPAMHGTLQPWQWAPLLSRLSPPQGHRAKKYGIYRVLAKTSKKGSHHRPGEKGINYRGLRSWKKEKHQRGTKGAKNVQGSRNG